MPVTPQITISGSTVDLFGVAQPGTLIVQLCGFGSQVPRIGGTAVIGQTAPLPIPCTEGAYSFKLWGNDVIQPLNSDGSPRTFYTIRVVDANGNTVQINRYQFTGTQAIDLASAQPYSPPQPTPPTPGIFFAWDIVPAGAIDGSNAVFTLPQAPSPAASLNLFKNGARMSQGIAYTLTGATITYEAAYIPQGGARPDSHICNYIFGS